MTRVNDHSLQPQGPVDSVGRTAFFLRPERLQGMRAGLRTPERRIFGVPLAAAVVGLAVGGVAFFANGADVYAVPALGLMTLTLIVALVDRFRRRRHVERGGLVLVALAAAVVIILVALPPYLFGGQLNGVIHRSAFSGPLLLLVSVLTASYAVRRFLGGTPSAQDLSLYPLIVLPVAIALTAYGLLLARVVAQGLGGLSLDLVTTPWGQDIVGDLAAGGTLAYQVGLRNHILGTLLLMAMTCLFSILPGVGAGMFLSEYPGKTARVVGFSTTMLRAMSVFIIGVAAINFVGLADGMPADSPLSELIRGAFSLGPGGAIQAGGGSFVTAALFLSLLVIPIIAKLTEEGLRSVPREIREGSVAMGASEGYGLRRVLLPWAAPNIVTGLLLGAAEAAGSLAIIMFIAGDGEHGVGPLSTVTSLDFALFSTRYGSQPFIQSMGYRAPTDYAYTAALLLLLITLGLTALALVLRARFARRYRGSLTIG